VASEGGAAPVAPRAVDGVVATTLGESRWPPAIALLTFMGLNIGLRVWLRGGSPIRVPWLVPGIEVVLLLTLFAADPGNIARPRRLHRILVALVGVLVAAALWATVLLVYDLIKGTGVTSSPSKLLASGALIWLGNNLSFALLYWLIDSGGPLAR
jgi:hypothetical protein